MNFLSGGLYDDITASGANYAAAAGDESDEHGRGSSSAVIEREHMFDKVVTPSDVGKLNRLVIPKQHAEKYFPLDASAHDKGLLLNFEDRNGKPWRFRYSYWNSSQSYVMTKGWSRFVKEKKLDAGDIVSFQRGVGELAKDRLFIDWRRRPDATDHHHIPPPPPFTIPHEFSFHRPWSPLFLHPPSRSDYSRFLHPGGPPPHQSHQHYLQPPPGYASGAAGHNYFYNNSNRVVNGNPCPPGSIFYLRSAAGGGGSHPEIGTAGGGHAVFNAVPVVQGKAAAKRLRLFGVNMDCPISESDDCEIFSSNPAMPLPLPPPPDDYSSPSSSVRRHGDDNDKGKGSMSLDLDI